MRVHLSWMLMASLFALSQCCGVTQHNVIANRAMHWFDPSLAGGEQSAAFAAILEDNQGAFQNGAAFPDWGYACFHSDESEAAHWPPFTLHSARFVRENCGMNVGNWTQECQQLGAFLFGVVAHQVADIPWHDLTATYPSRQGFIQEMANIEFDGDFGTAHTIADTGAEFVIAREFDLSFIIADWTLPVDALISIYASMNYNLEPYTLEACNVLLFAEVHAIKFFGDLLYPYAARRSVFLTDQQLNYWSGGMDANAAWVVDCWQEYLEFWLSPADDPPLTYPVCLMQEPIFGDYSHDTAVLAADGESLFKDHPFVREMAKFMLEHGFVSVVPNGEAGVSISVRDDAAVEVRNEAKRRLQSSQYLDKLDYTAVEAAAASSSGGAASVMGETPYAYFGHSLVATDATADSPAELFAGAPGYGVPGYPQLGAVFAVAVGPNATLPEQQLLLVGDEAMARFGWSVALADFNSDGRDDLVVGSPMSSSADLTYKGKVSVYFREEGGTFSSSPDITIGTERNYTNLGYVLHASDLDGDGVKDIAIGCPFAGSGTGEWTQAGRVFVFLSRPSLSSGTYLDAERDADWVMDGKASSSWYGYAIDSVVHQNRTLLLVGSPSHSDDEVCTGVLYAYYTDDIATAQLDNSQLPAAFSISGSEQWDMVGFSLAIGAFGTTESALALGIPNRAERGWQKKFMGAAGVVDLSSLSGASSVDDLDFLVYEEGDEEYARFGWRVALSTDSQANDCLWVTQPRRTTDAGHEAGVAYSFTATETTTTLGSEWALSRTGESIIFVQSSLDRVSAVFGAPRYNSTLEGAILAMPL